MKETYFTAGFVNAVVDENLFHTIKSKFICHAHSCNLHNLYNQTLYKINVAFDATKYLATWH